MTQEHIREVCWEIGTKFPIPFTSEYLTFSMIYPKRGYLQWHVKESSVHALQAKCGDAFHGSRLVIRIYDVTDVVFNGFNAHTFFDLDVHGIVGNYYMNFDRTERNLLAEFGFRFRDNSFHALVRSATIFFDRDRPSGKFDPSGLFVGKGFQPVFDVENVFDAPIYERISRELSGVERAEPLSVAVVFLGAAIAGEHSKPLERLIAQLNEGSQKFGGRIQMLTPAESSQADGKTLFASVERATAAAYTSLELAHTKTPFHLVHCHDWYSAPVGIQAIETLNLPFVLSLHSTEYERSQGGAMNEISSAICEREKAAVQAANLIIVPHSSTRQQVISLYGAAEDKVTIISEVFEHEQSTFQSIQDIKRSLGLNGDWPVALFAGEISHASGADLLMDALIEVSKRHGEAQFVFVGNGPLKGELEGRAWHGGVAHRCRFLGDVAREYFESVLLAADFIVIPGRTWQDSGLAQKAIEFGKPVLTTHQSHINCVTHGQNGLITYDNPGSIIWGLNEMLANPLQGNMLRLAAKRNANQSQSPESSAMEQYLLYEHLLKRIQGETHV
ncbi:glycosyl transferase, group 1 [Candidatus Moduliflexus flocculans]|uniref:Glycosyl transferase, group 1 n=1 Tax=Candidatus Moduliflexus flocculans TaxID=1499966 RepID=A0A081BT09_9BACT|nr:glycosyl transferase, group 1 [Candidatus Moduliflexus flocculans]